MTSGLLPYLQRVPVFTPSASRFTLCASQVVLLFGSSEAGLGEGLRVEEPSIGGLARRVVGGRCCHRVLRFR